MARKIEKVTIDAEGRDFGKTFVITEMPAWDAIRWAARAMLALSQSGVQVPEGALSGAPETIAASAMTLLALVPETVALPLLEEAKECVQYQASTNTAVALQPVEFGGIDAVEEPKTWAILLRRVFAIHVGFTTAGEPPITG